MNVSNLIDTYRRKNNWYDQKQKWNAPKTSLIVIQTSNYKLGCCRERTYLEVYPFEMRMFFTTSFERIRCLKSPSPSLRFTLLRYTVHVSPNRISRLLPWLAHGVSPVRRVSEIVQFHPHCAKKIVSSCSLMFEHEVFQFWRAKTLCLNFIFISSCRLPLDIAFWSALLC